MAANDDLPPVKGYDGLPARDAMRLLRDLPVTTLERLHGWEDRHQRRTVVLRAILRAIDRLRRAQS